MVLEVLALANQYGLVELLTSISEYLQAVLSIRNVCLIYDIARLYQLSSLAELCCDYIDRHASHIITTDSFLTLSASTLESILQRDSFCVPEVDIFRVAAEWVKRNGPGSENVLRRCVRLPLISLTDLLNVVRPSGLISSDSILDAIKARNEVRDTDLQYRGYLCEL
ncbi:BTBD9 [Cordylochernes scorpioides]|uniref:BTBD9 n=1 Tax=Cordylochernes scorpioides TaxID=51811 RepID=A0ABY6KEB1_9ARAC|nr:BTBD9 [Cordylochernes scorpioides]